MNASPNIARDYRGVCSKCHGLGSTELIDRGRWPLYHNYQEVTGCCHNPDFTPETYAVRCPACGQWTDDRYLEHGLCRMCWEGVR